MMRLIWGKEAHWQCKAKRTKSYLLSLSGKKAKFMSLPYYYGYFVTNWDIDFGFYYGF